MALFGVLALLLAGYLVNDALHASTTSPQPGAAEASTVPAGPVVSQPFQPVPADEPPAPEPANPAEQFLGVLVVPTDYWGKSGSDAVVTARSQGLVPRVVDGDGRQVDQDRRSRCRVTSVRPMAGFIPRGSTLELTCRRVR
jgi:hypothetical protein